MTCSPRAMPSVTQGQRLRGDPFVRTGDQWAGTVVAHVEVLDVAAGTDGVVGELFAVNEFFDVYRLDVPQLRNGGRNRFGVVATERVHGPGAGNGLDDERVAHLLCRRPDFSGGAGDGVMRHPHSAFGQGLLHEVFVAELERLLIALPRHPQRFPDLRSEFNAGLP
jgi:hypothetical protein